MFPANLKAEVATIFEESFITRIFGRSRENRAIHILIERFQQAQNLEEGEGILEKIYGKALNQLRIRRESLLVNRQDIDQRTHGIRTGRGLKNRIEPVTTGLDWFQQAFADSDMQRIDTEISDLESALGEIGKIGHTIGNMRAKKDTLTGNYDQK